MYRVGTDIVEVSRIRRLIDRYNTKFLNRIYSQDEILYCQDKNDPAIHFAGRFAAKEAIKKTSSMLSSIPYNQISVTNAQNGRPKFDLSDVEIDLSISHTSAHAISFAILISNEIRT